MAVAELIDLKDSFINRLENNPMAFAELKNALVDADADIASGRFVTSEKLKEDMKKWSAGTYE